MYGKLSGSSLNFGNNRAPFRNANILLTVDSSTHATKYQNVSLDVVLSRVFSILTFLSIWEKMVTYINKPCEYHMSLLDIPTLMLK